MMQPQIWTITVGVWGRHQPITARSGGRVVQPRQRAAPLHDTVHMPHLATGMMAQLAVTAPV